MARRTSVRPTYDRRFGGLGCRLVLVRDGRPPSDVSPITSPQAAYELLRPLANEPNECLAVVAMTTRHVPLGVYIAAMGGIDHATVEPRDIFKFVLVANADAVLLAHNHPSDDPTPSPDDIRWTGRVVAAGRLLGVRVVDHIIVGADAYCSLRERGVDFDSGGRP